MSHRSVGRLLAGGSALAVASALLFGVSAPLVAQQQPVSVFLGAVDRLGEPITDLEPSQVALNVDGTRCASVKLEPVNWPTKVQVLIDNSVTMRDDLPSLRDGVRAFLAELPEGVEVSMYVLSPQPRPLLRPTTDRQAIMKSVDVLAPDSGVAKFLDGLSEAVNRVTRDRGNFFYTIMAFTSNGTEGSNGNIEATWERLQKQLPERPLTVHVLMLSQTGQAALRTSGLQLTIGRAVTQGSGGRFENIGAVTILNTLFPEYARQIARSSHLQSHQYRITCESSTSKNPGIQLSTSHPRVANVFVSRNGQIAGS